MPKRFLSACLTAAAVGLTTAGAAVARPPDLPVDINDICTPVGQLRQSLALTPLVASPSLYTAPADEPADEEASEPETETPKINPFGFLKVLDRFLELLGQGLFGGGTESADNEEFESSLGSNPLPRVRRCRRAGT